MANPIVASKRASDFLRDFDMAAYVNKSAYVENTSGAAVTLKGPMYPLKAGSEAGFVEVMTSVEANTTGNIVGFLIVGAWEELAATTGVSMKPYAYLVNGPAVVSKEGYAVNDLAGDAYTPANFDTAFAAMAPKVVTADSSTSLTSSPFKL